LNIEGPSSLTFDNEMSMIKAAHTICPLTNVHGCRFHLGKNIYLHIQKCGLQTLYENSEIYSRKFRNLLGLAFLPIDEVKEAFQNIIDTNFFFDGEEKLTDFQVQGINKFN